MPPNPRSGVACRSPAKCEKLCCTQHSMPGTDSEVHPLAHSTLCRQQSWQCHSQHRLVILPHKSPETAKLKDAACEVMVKQPAAHKHLVAAAHPPKLMFGWHAELR